MERKVGEAKDAFKYVKKFPTFYDAYYNTKGYLVYVCTPYADFNDEVRINKFLKKFGNYRIVDFEYAPWTGNALKYYTTNINRKDKDITIYV